MITGINQKQVVDYVAKVDTGENPTHWGIGVLRQEDKNNLINDAINPDGTIEMRKLITNCVPLLLCGIKYIKNYRQDEDSEPKDYENMFITEAIIESIPTEVQFDLLDRLVAFNFVTKGEVKN